MPRQIPDAPNYESFAQGPVELKLRTVTPVLGGGAITRRSDAFDPIRAPAVRGHLRMWWRALYGPGIPAASGGVCSAKLFEREREIWGGLAGDRASRSTVDVEVDVTSIVSDADERAPNIVGGTCELTDDGTGVKGDVSIDQADAYALFSARAQVRKERNTRRIVQVDAPPAQRILPSVFFTLKLRFRDLAHQAEVLRAARAWVLFGGIGGRTRRGCGSLAFQTPENWLPGDLTELKSFVGSPEHPAVTSAGWLAGAQCGLGAPQVDATVAWTTALGWLKDFRQKKAGNSATNRDHAREAGRPAGVSNWPEADKLRHLGLIADGHTARTAFGGPPVEPAWPRASFGLPIVFDFKGGVPPRKKAELRWADGPNPRDEKDRLASPLITKPVQLSNDRFAPLVLWLSRDLPPGAQVFVKDARGTTEAPFDRLKGATDSHQFNALGAGTPPPATVRDAFFKWLGSRLVERGSL
jgi:CRISPR-associated protein Cmr1